MAPASRGKRRRRKTIIVAGTLALMVVAVLSCAYLIDREERSSSSEAMVQAGAQDAGEDTTQASADSSEPSDADGSSEGDASSDGDASGSDADVDGTQNGGQAESDGSPSDAGQAQDGDGSGSGSTAAELAADLGIVEDLHTELAHGPKGGAYQKYIVIHDTEVDATPQGIVDSWVAQGTRVAAHFVVGRDGSVVQCVPMDQIAHHAGFGDAGHNELFGVGDESRDDKVGTTSIGSAYPDYGMNSYSIGIELVHVGSRDEGYPEAQLEALDKLVAYIDAYYGSESQIIDHKAWRTTNSDTSAEFAAYLESYQTRRTHQ